jgi:3-hydroxyacyl-[acyl-carrier-protein] dehydratase
MMTDKQPLDLVLDVEDIKKLLPHRAPMLFVERLSDIVPFESATGRKAVGYNEPYFMGHFPAFAVMPGVLIVEALAQTAGALVMHSLGQITENHVVYFMTIEKVKFRRPVRPGDMLNMKVKALKRRGPMWWFSGEAYVDDVLCAEAQYSAMIQVPVKDSGKDENSSDGSR